MKIETTVRVRLTDTRGQSETYERLLVTATGDNPRFLARSVAGELDAAGGTVIAHVRRQHGDIDQEEC